MSETAYTSPNLNGTRLTHFYGPNVHVLADPWSLSLVGQMSRPECVAPVFHKLLEAGFRRILQAATEHLPRTEVSWATRMAGAHPHHAHFKGVVVDPRHPVVLVDIARGGIVPTYVMQQELLNFMDPESVRVDHLFMQRIADKDGRVTGVDLNGSKIGGPIANRTVIIPDPMAATGSSISDALKVYADIEGGPPHKIIVCHLIVTPEYLRKITKEFPHVEIYALRVDRGLSPPDVLGAIPGSRWDEEVGLNDHGYIVPGAGGLGELINNAFV